MPRMNMVEAINSAMDVCLGSNPDVVVLGEDIGYFGGVFRATAGLQAKHGKTRVFDTPINECGIIGVAVGMAAYGLLALGLWHRGAGRRKAPASKAARRAPPLSGLVTTKAVIGVVTLLLVVPI